jgi:hypothetical protein
VKIELIGGPRDGEVLEVHETQRELHIPAPPKLCGPWTPESETEEVLAAVFNFGTYAAHGKPTEFYWRGYRGDDK